MAFWMAADGSRVADIEKPHCDCKLKEFPQITHARRAPFNPSDRLIPTQPIRLGADVCNTGGVFLQLRLAQALYRAWLCARALMLENAGTSCPNSDLGGLAPRDANPTASFLVGFAGSRRRIFIDFL